MRRSRLGAREFGQALCEFIERKTDPQIVITMDLATLLGGIRPATLPSGDAISAGEARRLACQATLIPMVLDGESRPLDVGRGNRYYATWQRKALAKVHQSCAGAGCSVPVARCHLHHHTQTWANGGHTDLADALPLCPHHHRRIHDPAYQTKNQPDGKVSFHRRP